MSDATTPLAPEAREALPASSQAPPSGRPGLVPLAALLRRDLLAGGRGARSLVARALAILLSGSVVLACFQVSAFAQRNEIAGGGALAIFAGLVAVGFLIGPAVAASALRLEREAGMLDLLLLAGIRPTMLALGRMLSTWLFLQSLLFAALPALAILWYFRAPAPLDLLLAAATLTGHFFALSGVLVAISANARHGGFAIALSVVVLGTWAGLMVVGLNEDVPGTTLRLLDAAVGKLEAPLGSVPLKEHVLGWIGSGVIGLASLGLATAGLQSRAPAAPRDVLRERIDRAPRPVSNRLPLTSLLHRRSAPARPIIQAILIVPCVLLVALLGSAEFLAASGILLVAIGLLVALMAGATSIAPERERRTWTSLVTTRLGGDAIIVDLLASALSSSAVPVLAGLLAAFGPAALLAAVDIGVMPWILGAGAILLTWLFACVAGIGASLVTSRTAGAVGLAAAAFFGMPVVGFAASELAAALARSTLDGGGMAAWLALLFAAAFGGTWLVLRAGFADRLRASLAFLPTITMAFVPLLLGTPAELLGLAPFAIFGAAGIAMLAHGLRRGRGAMAYLALLLVFACILIPVTTTGLSAEDRLVAAFGGSSWLIGVFAAVVGDGPPPLVGTLIGVPLQLMFVFALFIAFRPRLERWLGRSG